MTKALTLGYTWGKLGHSPNIDRSATQNFAGWVWRFLFYLTAVAELIIQSPATEFLSRYDLPVLRTVTDTPRTSLVTYLGLTRTPRLTLSFSRWRSRSFQELTTGIHSRAVIGALFR